MADSLSAHRDGADKPSREGRTATIAEYIADVIQHHGHEAEPVTVKQARDPGVRGYDGVIVGASIHMGKHDKPVVELVRQIRDTLERLPSAFFSGVCPPNGDTEEAEGYVGQFEQEAGWRPASVGLFGGALLYTQYGFIKRHVMKKIAQDKPGDLGTDTSRDYVYTRVGWRTTLHRGLPGEADHRAVEACAARPQPAAAGERRLGARETSRDAGTAEGPPTPSRPPRSPQGTAHLFALHPGDRARPVRAHRPSHRGPGDSSP